MRTLKRIVSVEAKSIVSVLEGEDMSCDLKNRINDR